MTQIFGRLTADAQVKIIEEGKTVVNFTLALNDYYKPKGANEGIERVEFIQCGYWFNAGIAASLKKGAVIEVGGWLFATGYIKGNEPKGQINMQVQHIKVHVFAKKDEPQQEPPAPQELWQEQQETKGGGKSGKTNNAKSNKAKPQEKSEPFVPTEVGDDLPF